MTACFAFSQAMNSLSVNSSGRGALDPDPVPAEAVGVATALDDATRMGEARGLEAMLGVADAMGTDVATAADEAMGVSAAASAEDGTGVGTTSTADEEVTAAGVEEEITATEDAADTSASPESPAMLTDVVSSPLSMYTPLKYQSSAPVPSLLPGRRRTPRCQSAPLEEVLAVNGPAVFVNALLPVECQKVTEPASKSISYATLCHSSATSSTSHFDTPPTCHCSFVLLVPCPPYLSSVK